MEFSALIQDERFQTLAFVVALILLLLAWSGGLTSLME